MKKFVKLFLRIGLKCLTVLIIINLCFALLNDHPLKSFQDILEINNFPQKVDHNVNFVIFATERLFERLVELKDEFRESTK